MDQRLLERSVEVAKKSGGFDDRKLPKAMRIAVDSAPFEGAGRDVDWTDTQVQIEALNRLVDQVESLDAWVATQSESLQKAMSEDVTKDLNWQAIAQSHRRRHQRRHHPLSFRLTNTEDPAVKQEIEMQERALFYVAPTRARRAALITAHGTPIPYLRV